LGRAFCGPLFPRAINYLPNVPFLVPATLSLPFLTRCQFFPCFLGTLPVVGVLALHFLSFTPPIVLLTWASFYPLPSCALWPAWDFVRAVLFPHPLMITPHVLSTLFCRGLPPIFCLVIRFPPHRAAISIIDMSPAGTAIPHALSFSSAMPWIFRFPRYSPLFLSSCRVKIFLSPIHLFFFPETALVFRGTPNLAFNLSFQR